METNDPPPRRRSSPRDSLALAYLAALVAIVAIVGLLVFFSRSAPGAPPPPADAAIADEPSATAHITFLQLNDIYELEAVRGGRYGGLARVKTVVDRLKRQNPNTLTALAGDLFSPSAIGNAKVDGVRLQGKQIVDVFNRVPLDYFTFGNHEFDLARDDFLARLGEAQFSILSSNVADPSGQPHPRVQGPAPVIRMVDGVALGIAGICMEINGSEKEKDELRRARPGDFKPERDYFRIQPPLERAAWAVAELKKMGADIIVLITHQSMGDDQKLGETVPGIDLIIGGHEHEQNYVRAGKDLTPIAKADANSRTVFIHDLYFDRATRQTDVVSKLYYIDRSIPEDADIKRRIESWKAAALPDLTIGGYKPDDVVAQPTVDLDGTEASVRNETSALAQLIVDAYREAYQSGGPGGATAANEAELALLNGGSIRVDEVFEANLPITGYDILRISPFGGNICLADMPGETLIEALNTRASSRKSGAFLHYSANVAQEGSGWTIDGAAIDPARRYRVALPFYLVDKGDAGLGFLTLSAGAVKRAPDVVDAPIVDTILHKLVATYGAAK